MASRSILHQSQWRQGSVIPRDLIPAEDLPPGLPTEDRLIAISHDCDIAHLSYEVEPWLEILVARPVATVNGLLIHGQNPRRIQFWMGEAEARRLYEADIHEKFRTKRRLLEPGSPDSSVSLAKRDVVELARWAGKRYFRPALPSAFNDRISRVIRKVRRILERDGAEIQGIFLGLTDRELPLSETYDVILRLVISVADGADVEIEQKVLGVLVRLQELLNECEGINVYDALVCTEAEFTLEDLRNTTWWDYEYLSAEEEI